MPTCTIDGIKIEFEEGENLIKIAKKAGIEIPVFCYHPGLSVVAQCRMCAVDVEKMPKIQTACSTVAQDGMIVSTQTDRVKKARESVMEFLLVNHPLDCPICDKAGECDLQDHSYEHGNMYQRSVEERRTYVDLDMGPVIKKNMNRCIHCTRCIRFGDEIANIREMVAINRGNNTEITTLDGRSLETDYAGNYADVCPTGSLTLKDFRFHKRAWMLQKTDTICEGCSRGCNMEMHQDRNIIYRCLPRENMEINQYWLCDEGRLNFNYVHDESRIRIPTSESNSELDWGKGIEMLQDLQGSQIFFLIGTDLTSEEMQLIQDFSTTELKGSQVAHFGTDGIQSSKGDGDLDSILKRTSKTSNLHGAEKLGIKPFTSIPKGAGTVIIIRGGRAQLPKLDSKNKKIGLGVFFDHELTEFDMILPGGAFAEKSGTVINFQGIEQKLNRVITPPRESKLLPEVLMLWKNKNQNTGVA